MEYPRIFLNVDSINSEGAGVARNQGRVFFIPGAAPGDRVLAQVDSHHANYSMAYIVDIVDPSPERAEPFCPYYGMCGGCQLQHLSYPAQLKAKKALVLSALERVGGLQNPPVADVIASPRQRHYRSRIQLQADAQGRLGFFKASSHEVVDIEACPISDEAINAQIPKIRSQPKPPPPGSKIELRTDASGAFTQVNPEQNRNLIRIVMEFLDPKKTDQVFDLFAGSGNLTFPISQRAKKVWAIEKDDRAVEEGMAKSDAASNILWKAAPVAAALTDLRRQGVQCDAIVADPPRKGLAEAVEGILAFKPKKIVYVSCDPATLARDAGSLVKAGYRLESCQPIDMFPQTAHVEVIGLFVQGTVEAG